MQHAPEPTTNAPYGRARLTLLVGLLALAGPGIGAARTQEAAPAIVELARSRHAAIDTSLLDYRSRINTRASIGLQNDPLRPPQLVLASELAAAVAWQRDQGLQIRMLGQRYVFGLDLSDDGDAALDFGRPWFISTVPGDSLRVLGAIDIPTRAAIHPFAPGAHRYYDYTVGDTVSLLTPGRTVDLVEVQVTPTRGDAALVVGSLWVDVTSGDVAVMQIRFVGKPLWASADDPDGSSLASRVLSVAATVENGLWDGRFWLPHRQELEVMVRIPLIGDFAVPVLFRSDFGRYDVNTGESIAWMAPDSARTPAGEGADGRRGARDEEVVHLRIGSEPADADSGGATTVVRAGAWKGGWEIVRPPDDSLRAWDGWDQPLVAPESRLRLPEADDLERRARALSAGILGRRALSIRYDRLPEMIRYNRVEALALGLSARWDIPRVPFWSVGGAASFGVADLEPKGKLDLRYDAPRTRLELAGYSELHIAGSTLTDDRRAFGNAFRALLLGRDDADYYRATGARVALGRRWGAVRLRGALGVEDHSSVERETGLALPDIWQDSVFRPNPPVAEGTSWRADLETTVFLGDWSRAARRGELVLGAEVGTGPDGADYVQPRVGLETRADAGRVAAFAAAIAAGWTGGRAPVQRELRIGGLSTVRGFDHGVRQGDAYWTGRLEVTHRFRIVSPVLFGDLGWAGATDDWPGGDVVWAAGVGASVLNGIVRADLAFPEDGDARLELYLAGPL